MRKFLTIALFVIGLIVAAANYFGLLRKEFSGTAAQGEAERRAAHAHRMVGIIAALLAAFLALRMVYYAFIRG